ncbi:MAG: pyrimidine 5'-nucleotidase [Flexistipes sinusarabici]|uniref:Pyrimidine 5'-nucleotidase n=1 Tax=Flexistipes sinusarabici TaxID=2352 RepID=A0A5D0MMA8_FLESI|nr:pyrimidine 5'-nucleotidase [Flexistipes sinusarabici]TYB32580.1 MAG: pyrimidine 5'-nucleotidase [Flexistipes sinusarabici]
MQNYIFDLDNTLYHPDTGILEEVNNRINSFMINKVGIHYDEVDFLRRTYREKYGVTLRGLMYHYSVKPSEYLDYVHDLAYDEFINKDPLLKNCLENLEGYRAVFTNGAGSHALNILSRLGVYECFDDIFSIEDVDYTPKIYVESFKKMMDMSGINPGDSILFEDTCVNLTAAAKLGFKTALIGSGNGAIFDYHFSSIYDIVSLTKAEQTC